MTFYRSSLRSAALAALAILALTSRAHAECKLVGGIGNGITEGIAQFMSDAALKNLLEAKGLKPSGEVRHKCKAVMLGSECTATQQGCK